MLLNDENLSARKLLTKDCQSAESRQPSSKVRPSTVHRGDIEDAVETTGSTLLTFVEAFWNLRQMSGGRF